MSLAEERAKLDSLPHKLRQLQAGGLSEFLLLFLFAFFFFFCNVHLIGFYARGGAEDKRGQFTVGAECLTTASKSNPAF